RSLISDADECEASVVRDVGVLVKRPTRSAVLRQRRRGERKRETSREEKTPVTHTPIVLRFAGAPKVAAASIPGAIPADRLPEKRQPRSGYILLISMDPRRMEPRRPNPSAPPVYRPCRQMRPAAPPVYRPQASPGSVQASRNRDDQHLFAAMQVLSSHFDRSRDQGQSRSPRRRFWKLPGRILRVVLQ